ncbi:MAG: hypothetical protein U1F33_11180 [Alphaproteobacteria bacterium]
MNRLRNKPGITALLAFAAILSGNALAAEEATIRAFSAWDGQGRTIQTGENEATFIGAISGRLYVETDNGPVDVGQLLCPATARINLRDSSQSAHGSCTIVGTDSSRAFGDFQCKGVHLVGCDGELTFTGGTGRFTGITGGGHFGLRSNFRSVAMASGGPPEIATGIIYWRELHYKLP